MHSVEFCCLTTPSMDCFPWNKRHQTHYKIIGHSSHLMAKLYSFHLLDMSNPNAYLCHHPNPPVMLQPKWSSTAQKSGSVLWLILFLAQNSRSCMTGSCLPTSPDTFADSTQSRGISQGTSDILCWLFGSFFIMEAILGTAGHLTATLALPHYIQYPDPHCNDQNVPRHCPMSPGGKIVPSSSAHPTPIKNPSSQNIPHCQGHAAQFWKGQVSCFALEVPLPPHPHFSMEWVIFTQGPTL